MIKRVIVTLSVKEGKATDMSVVPENIASRVDILMLLNAASKVVLESVMKEGQGGVVQSGSFRR